MAAAGVRPTSRAREPWLDLAQFYHDAKDWAGGYHAATRALRLDPGPVRDRTFGYAWRARRRRPGGGVRGTWG